MSYCAGLAERRMRVFEGSCQQLPFSDSAGLSLPFEDFLQFLFQSASGQSGWSVSSPSSPVSSDTDNSELEDYDDGSEEDEQEVFRSASFQIRTGLIPRVSIRFATRTPSMSSQPDQQQPEHGPQTPLPNVKATRRPFQRSDSLAFYKNFSASYGRRRGSKTSWLDATHTPLSSAKGLSRSVPMKLNGLAKKKRQTQSWGVSPVPAVLYTSPEASAQGHATSREVESGTRAAGSKADAAWTEDEMERLENRTQSLFLNAATSPGPSQKKPKKKLHVTLADVSMGSGSERKTSQLLHRRKTLC